jgi:hypothetical protein
MQKRFTLRGAMGAAKKARTSTKPADTKRVPEKEAQDVDTRGGRKEEDEAFNVFTLDMDTVECPICSLQFDSHIYTVSI